MRLVRIPKERVGALIGDNGEIKELIEKRAGVRLYIDSDGEIKVEENPNDPLAALKVMDLIKAIGRGFAPHRAMRLLDEDEYLEVIDISYFVGKKSNRLSRVRSGSLVPMARPDGSSKTSLGQICPSMVRPFP